MAGALQRGEAFTSQSWGLEVQDPEASRAEPESGEGPLALHCPMLGSGLLCVPAYTGALVAQPFPKAHLEPVTKAWALTYELWGTQPSPAAWAFMVKPSVTHPDLFWA